MKIKPIVDQIQHEINVAKGEETRDLFYSSERTYPTSEEALNAFARSVEKLRHVNDWSSLSSLTADFVLHDSTGGPKSATGPEAGDYIQIILPGPMPENWVRVTHVAFGERQAEFTVQPSKDPRNNDSDQIEHFFQKEASSTFRVAVAGNTLTACEIGKNEAINNQEPEAGDRSVLNTLLAEGGWLFYQKMQWKLLTDYLVHL
ncbi:hypothetical protein [Spirosoma aerophilum]